MRNKRSVVTVVAIALVLAGCDSGGRASGKPPAGKPSAQPSVGGGAEPVAGQGIVRDSIYQINYMGEPYPFRMEMKQVERFKEYSVLRFAITNIGPKPQDTSMLFGNWYLDRSFGRIALVDTVGRKYYFALRAQDDDGFGSQNNFTSLEPGVPYEGHVYYPVLPGNVERVMVRTPGAPGSFPGVPVVQGTTRPPTSLPNPSPSPSPTGTLAADAPTGEIKTWVADLTDIRENDTQTTTSGGGEEKIGLRTDVLFDFDKATLTGKAKAVLDQVANETREKADPAKPPITITGHTDSKGDDAYNMRLSQQRAEAVRKELQARLGGAYRYVTAGKGETEPAVKEGGADDEQARQKNRRVDISYKIKQQLPGTTTTTTAAPGAVAPPARFRTDGKPVAERTGVFRGQQYRIRVAPFYRDGAYLAVPFEISLLDDKERNTGLNSPFGVFDKGGRFGAFSVVDPATKIIYRAVRIGSADSINYLEGDIGTNTPKLTFRSYIYVAAPPANTTSVTFDAGAFGQIPGVPIQ
ncbi:OmpA family protein [Actinomadura macrotermitis]|uniref:OmpA-like domain-containing protein n=1 Tax=Actinomadura macrotermitis TaxID=2585200 RepID=A0A7K0BT26_9ACTN|nr:OmpA family protein [Actinomadura macrotermitis]MQY03834.1 hypothetical protein [Actinomadura macrotermitis]